MSDSFLLDMAELNTLAVDLGRVPAKIVPLALAILEKSSADIERDAKIFCPVATGNLRASISRDVMGLTAEIGPTASYGAYVEFGGATRAPAAYLGPAFDRHAGQFNLAMGKIAGDVL